MRNIVITIKEGALFTDMDTSIDTPQIFIVGTHVGFAGNTLRAEIRACACYARLYV
jgi:hypothetical protein